MTYILESVESTTISSASNNDTSSINRSIVISVLNSANPEALLNGLFPMAIPMKGMLPTVVFQNDTITFEMSAILFETNEREVKYIIPSLFNLKLCTEFGRRTLDLMSSDSIVYYLEQYCSSPFIRFEVVG